MVVQCGHRVLYVLNDSESVERDNLLDVVKGDGAMDADAMEIVDCYRDWDMSSVAWKRGGW